MKYIGIDVGGHTITAGAADFSETPARLLRAETVAAPSPRTAAGLVETAAALVSRFASAGEKCFVGVGLPGFVGRDRKTVARLTNYENCDGLALGDMLERRLAAAGFAAKAVIENAANCAALGEGMAGEAAGMDDYVVLTLGTGIGAGIVSGGRLLRGAHGMAAECGHMALCGPSLRGCGCGGAGHLEEAASADWLERRASEAGLPADFRKLWEMRGASEAGAILDPALETLARGVASICAALDPEAVILSGGMSRAEGIAEEISARAEKYLPAPYRPYFSLKASKLGGEAAVIGAASLCAEGYEFSSSAGSCRAADYKG